MIRNLSLDKQQIREYLNSNNVTFLNKGTYSESALLKIAKIIAKESEVNRKKIAANLILNITSCGKAYDWNIGSILQHLCSDLVITTLKNTNQVDKYYNSIGLSWVLGEYNRKDQFVIEFLYAIINNSTDSDAWWRAAFSLENMGIEEAVNLLKRSLKARGLKSLKFYLNNLSDKKSIIGILTLCNVDNTQRIIYPSIKRLFLSSDDCNILINCCWVIGRFNLVDKEVFDKLVTLVKHKNYELRYYTFFALQNSDIEILRPFLENALFDDDPLIRKMACRSTRNMTNDGTVATLYEMLDRETETSVISEISKTIYYLKNPNHKNKLNLDLNSHKNENGLIIDETDKWYKDAAIYNIFSESEDPENLCFDLVLRELKNKKIINPIDLATGTGRTLW